MGQHILHKELSYRLIGILYKVYNAMGAGYQEKYYQRAIKQELLAQNIPFLEQVRADLMFRGEAIGRYYMDFVIEHKIVLELKTRMNFSKRDVLQVLGYLKQSGLDLGILVTFASEGLKHKRVLRGFGNKFGDSRPNSGPAL